MQVSLKRNGWHRRLQNFVFDYPPTFNSLCPYFWFTIFCMFASPFVFLYEKVLHPAFHKAVGIVETSLDFVDRVICTPLFESQILSMSGNSLFYTYENHTKYEQSTWRDKEYKKVSKASKRFKKFRELWIRKNGGGTKEFNEAVVKSLKEKAAKIQKAEEKKAIQRSAKESENRLKSNKREASRKKMFANIVKYTQWVAPVAISALGLALLYGVYRLFAWLSTLAVTTDWYKVGQFCLAALILIALIALFVAIVVVIVKLAKKCELKIPFPSFAWVPNMFKAIGRFFVRFGGKFGSGIVAFAEFFVMYAKAAKESYCPMIEWEDK